MVKVIQVEVRGGVVTDVHNLPRGWKYEVLDHDDCDAVLHSPDDLAGPDACEACKTDHGACAAR